MIRKLFSICIVLALFSATSAFAITRYVSTVGGCGGNTPCYPTIQAAINAASNGDVIEVAAGAYGQSIILNKQLTLRGAQAGVDARGRTAAETVLISLGISITIQALGQGSTIDGFTFGGSGTCIGGVSSISGIQILNNRFLGFSAAAIGISGPNWTIDKNEIDGSSQNWSAFALIALSTDNIDGLYVTNNILRNGAQRGLGANGNWNVGSQTGRSPLISGNTFRDFGGQALNFGGGSFENGEISMNMFDHTLGSAIYGGIRNSTISQNDFHLCARGIRFTPDGNPSVNRGAYNNAIQGNLFSASTDADIVMEDTYSSHFATNTFSGNSFTSSLALRYAWGGRPENFSGNWWGSNSEAAILSKITPSPYGVDHTPWLDSGIDLNGVTAGFLGNFAALWVNDDYAQTLGTGGRIQEGVNTVTAGGTVHVLPGVYGESQILINVPVNLLGAGAATTIIDGGGGSGLTDPGLIRITTTTGDVTVDGFTIRNAKSATGMIRTAVFAASTAALPTFTVSNHVITGSGNPAEWGNFGIYSDGGQETLIISNNQISAMGLHSVWLLAHAGPTDTRENTWDRGVHQYGYSGYLNQGGGGSDITSLQQVRDNFIDLGGNGPYDIGHSSYGITFWGSNAGGFTNVQIHGNEISNLGDYRHGIRLGNPYGGSSDLHASTVSDNIIRGLPNNPNSIGVYLRGLQDQTSVNFNQIEEVAQGVLIAVDNGVATNSMISGNKFIAPGSLALQDDGTNSTWDMNCYSDHNAGHAGYPDYNIGGTGGFIDQNPSSSCVATGLTLRDEFIGCDPADGCAKDTFYVSIDRPGLANLELVYQFPPVFALDLIGIVADPISDADPNLLHAFAQATGTDCVKVNIAWQPPYSSGNYAHRIAAIPFRNVSGITGAYAITGIRSRWFDDQGVPYINDVTPGDVNVVVDCDVSVATFTNEATCAYGSAAQLEGQFPISVLRGGLTQSPLDTAYVEINGNSAQRLFLVPPATAGDLVSPYFPDATQAAMLYGWMTEGCNDVTLYYRDTECNTGSITLSNVGRDNTAPPAPVITNSTPPNFCYNNLQGSDHYGGEWLDDYLDIFIAVDAGPCAAISGVPVISYAGVPDFVVPIGVTNYPTTDLEAELLWSWMLQIPGFATSNGTTFTFDVVRTMDCAGNLSTASQFSICVDTQAPVNSFTVFDARPTHLGVWLNWEWQAGADATEMRVYRSPISGEYPGYPIDLWSYIASYDVNSVPPLGWILVAQQSGTSGSIASATYAGTNNRGDYHQHMAGPNTYWLDAEVGWVDGDNDAPSYRDVYRYVTFVKDANGNWSTGYTVSYGVNADRSTNYWLGDFATADAGGTPASRGRVNSEDLAVLSAYFYTSPGSNYTDIGPVVVENGSIARGLPNADGNIDFFDLIPFSFNYNAVTPVGQPFEFKITPPHDQRGRFEDLDTQPVVSLSQIGTDSILTGGEFTVSINLLGNVNSAIKIAEAEVTFDSDVLELVSTNSIVPVISGEGEAFSKIGAYAGRSDRIGAVSAALGESSSLQGDVSLATITLRWKNDRVPNTELELAYRLADKYGAVAEGNGGTLTLGASGTIPTDYVLYQNFPNPFNPSTEIVFDLPEQASVKLQVYNTLGQLVTTLIATPRAAGHYSVNWNAADLASGLYIYRLEANDFVQTKKMMLIR